MGYLTGLGVGLIFYAVLALGALAYCIFAWQLWLLRHL
ncbi:MAG: hypothetical protein JWL77_2772 [Chthonomonadaceae bacterium]|nr:hypothetical protein [Chthonomonadaceae bacterium]